MAKTRPNLNLHRLTKKLKLLVKPNICPSNKKPTNQSLFKMLSKYHLQISPLTLLNP